MFIVKHVKPLQISCPEKSLLLCPCS